jgi:hypothetical protein
MDFLFLPQYVMNKEKFETEDDLKRCQHVVPCNKYNVLSFGRIVL